MTKSQRTGIALMWAYLSHNARKCSDREQVSWLYLLAWAEMGGKTSDVPKAFGGTA